MPGRSAIRGQRACRLRVRHVLAVALVLAAGSAAAAARGPFGPFAGYLWIGKVISVRASWTVPRILPGSRIGLGANWIGAQGLGTNAPFIQIGAIEDHSPTIRGRQARSVYLPFWSDTLRHFHAQVLPITIAPGDHLSARLARSRGRWELWLSDDTTGAAVHFYTREEARFGFKYAEWLEEDPSSSTHRPLPYPNLAAVHFRDVQVNGAVPVSSRLHSQWLSLPGRDLAPTRFLDGSFTLHDAVSTPAGRRYLALAAPFNGAADAFDAQIGHWTARTSAQRVRSACLPMAAAIRVDIRALGGSPWPARSRRLIAVLIRRTRVILHDVRAGALTGPPGALAVKRAWFRDGRVLGHVAQLVRRTLALPH
jgi:Peptidase A4 family